MRRTSRSIYSAYRKGADIVLGAFNPRNGQEYFEMRQAYLEGVIDALRTAGRRPRSPYQPEAYAPELRELYALGFSCR